MTRSVDRRCEFPVLKFGIIVYISNVFHVQYETTECRLDIFCRCSSRFGGTTTLGANIVPTAQGGRTKMVCIGPFVDSTRVYSRVFSLLWTAVSLRNASKTPGRAYLERCNNSPKETRPLDRMLLIIPNMMANMHLHEFGPAGYKENTTTAVVSISVGNWRPSATSAFPVDYTTISLTLAMNRLGPGRLEKL